MKTAPDHPEHFEWYCDWCRITYVLKEPEHQACCETCGTEMQPAELAANELKEAA